MRSTPPTPNPRKCGDVFFIPRGDDRGAMPRHVAAQSLLVGQTEIRASAFCINGYGLILAFKPFAVNRKNGETRNLNMGRWYTVAFESSNTEIEWNPDPAEPDLTTLQYA